MAIIYISIGSNQNAAKQIAFARVALERQFSELEFSSVFESKAVGFDGDNFLNLAARATTQLTISQVDQVFKKIEKQAGRRRDVPKFSDRSLDIDLLLYDSVVCSKPFRLPRGEITKHAFVLKPMAEIAPQLRHPETKQTMLFMWDGFMYKEEQPLWALDFDWAGHIEALGDNFNQESKP